MLALRGHYHSVQHQHVLSGAFKPSSDPDNTATKSQQHLQFQNTRFQKLFSVKDTLTAEHTHTHTHSMCCTCPSELHLAVIQSNQHLPLMLSSSSSIIYHSEYQTIKHLIPPTTHYNASSASQQNTDQINSLKHCICQEQNFMMKTILIVFVESYTLEFTSQMHNTE